MSKKRKNQMQIKVVVAYTMQPRNATTCSALTKLFET